MPGDGSTTLVVIDLVGIFVFAISGGLVAVRKGLDVFGVLVLAGCTGLGGLGPVAATLMGLVTAIGGGMLRDLLAGRVPLVLRPGTLYAFPAAAGSAVAAFGMDWGFPTTLVTILGALVCGAWRLAPARPLAPLAGAGAAWIPERMSAAEWDLPVAVR